MRGNSKDTIWLFMGVLLLFMIMASFSPGSQIGSAFLNFRGSIEKVFGGGVGYCPFINPYAMAIYSAGELYITGGHALCDPVEYTLNKEDAANFPAANFPHGDATCQKDYSIKIGSGGQFVEDGVIAEGDFDELDNLLLVTCIDCNTVGVDTDTVLRSDIFFQHFADYQIDPALEGLIEPDNKIAIQLLTEKRPAWQCFFIFGLLPFFVTFYLLNDILMFAYLRTNTRRLIAIFASLLAILTGSFANILVAVASFVGLSVGQSFLMAIFSLAILSVFLGQLTVTAGVAKTTVDAVQKAVTGALVLTNVAGATNPGAKKE
ncbi:MAG: hypothetical protein GOU98_00425 [Candidatus Altiarchaeota archaeon]|nr:hypothetical protein [Candidatus Altiarchaeota archaeon]